MNEQELKDKVDMITQRTVLLTVRNPKLAVELQGLNLITQGIGVLMHNHAAAEVVKIEGLIHTDRFEAMRQSKFLQRELNLHDLSEKVQQLMHDAVARYDPELAAEAKKLDDMIYGNDIETKGC